MKIGPNMSLDMAEGNSLSRLNMFSDFLLPFPLAFLFFLLVTQLT